MNTGTIKINMFRALGLMTVGCVFLNIVFGRLPFPLNSNSFYVAAWLFLLLVMKPQALVSKHLFPIYGFGVLYYFGFKFWWTDLVNTRTGEQYGLSYIIPEMVSLLLALLMYTYFFGISRDVKGIRMVVGFASFCILITCITTITGVNIFPGAIRAMASGTTDESLGVDISYLRSLGIGTYGFFVAVMMLIPLGVYHLKQSRFITKLALALALSIALYAIIKAENTTIFILSVFAILFALTSRGKLKTSVFLLVLTGLFIGVFYQPELAEFFYWAAGLFPDSLYEVRLYDIAAYFEQGATLTGGDSYLTDVRFEVILVSLNSFISNPLIGGGFTYNHAFWFDRLALFGVLGAIPWIWLFVIHIKNNYGFFTKKDRLYYVIALSFFMLYGMLKGGLGTTQTFVAAFFLIPGVFFLGYKSNKDKQ